MILDKLYRRRRKQCKEKTEQIQKESSKEGDGTGKQSIPTTESDQEK